jgi:anti-sigma factor RsiW
MNSTSHTTHDALSAHIDGELSADRSQEIAEHLTTCAQCSAEYEAMLETIAALHSQIQRYTAPDVLRARIRAAVATMPSEAAPAVPPRLGRHGRWRRAAVAAAALMVAAALGSAVTLATRTRVAGGPPIAAEVLASHVRSLMPDHLTDVRSSDQHNVKPWFNGRLDYSPNVPRLDERGFPLIGGRIDYVGGRPVAVVVYGRRQHMINVYSWPTREPDAAPAASAANGYNLLHWRSGGTERWVVSDLNAEELRAFAALLRLSS